MAAWLVAPLAGQAAAQAARSGDPDVPDWMIAWSPLAPIADHQRALPRLGALPGLVRGLEPRVGLLWTTGSPAGLPREVADRRAELTAAVARDAGAYRRPLDPDDVSARRLSGLAWQPLGSRGASAGRVVLEDATLGMGSFADALRPYGSNPLVPTDSSQPAMRRVGARLEGALGWQFGSWSAGLAAGFEVWDHRTRAARFARQGRASQQGGSIGVGRELPIARAVLALQARWTGEAEQVSLLTQPDPGVVYQLEGLSEPNPRAISADDSYFRRMERNAWAVGLAASGEVSGVRWALDAARTFRKEGQWSTIRRDPPTDRWRADGWTFAGAAQGVILDGRLLLTARLAHSTLAGEAARFDLDGVIFRARETVTRGGLDARYTPPASPWRIAANLRVAREWERRRDFIDRIQSDLVRWLPSAALEIARTFGEATTAAVGVGVAPYSAVGDIPDPEQRGSIYQILIAPELSFYGTRAIAAGLGVSLSHRFGSGASLLLGARRDLLCGWRNETTVPFAPTGRRNLWRANVGVLLSG